MMSCAGPAACNLHTAIALVSKMRAMGIEASCKQLVMQPSVALERRKQQQSRQQVRECHSMLCGSSCKRAELLRAGSLEERYPGTHFFPWDKSVFINNNLSSCQPLLLELRG